MATFTQNLSNDSRYSITLTVTEVLPDDYLVTNKTNVNYTLTATKSSGSGYYTVYSENPVLVIINGTTVVDKKISYDFTSSTPQTITLASGTLTGISHNNDGTKKITVSGYFNDVSNNLGSATATGTLTLTSIPRYANITSFSSQAINDETTIRLTWNTDVEINRLWYSKDGGSTYTNMSASGTSGTITLTNLSVGTSYTFKLKVRRADNNLTTPDDQAKQVSGKTYNYPYITTIRRKLSSDIQCSYIAETRYNRNMTMDNRYVDSLPASLFPFRMFYIGYTTKQWIDIYNPLGREINIYMKKENTSGTTLWSTTTTSSGKYSFQVDTNAMQSTLYSSIPNGFEGTAIYYCEYNSHIVSTFTGKYYIEANKNVNPSFNSNNFGYTANLTSLTNNNQVIINNYSNATINITTPATSSYGANISSYAVTWGNASGESSSTTIPLSGTAGGNTISVRVTDSRNQITTITKTIDSSNIVQYSSPCSNSLKFSLHLSNTFSSSLQRLFILLYISASLSIASVDKSYSFPHNL